MPLSQPSFSKLLCPLLVLLLLLPAGCAKSPGTGGSSPVSGPQLLVTMTVAGNINPSYYYYILFNVNNAKGPNNSSVTGPVPVVAAPFGNGYAAGAFTNYVEYNGGQAGGTNFNYYAVDPTLFNSQPLGPARLVQAQAVGSTLTFQLPLAYLANSNTTVDQITNLEVNFITTNVVPPNGENISVAKYFDALYPPQQSGNSYVSLIIRDVNGTLLPNIFTNNSLGVNEAGGDVAQYVNSVPVIVSGTTPDGVTTNDLDITGWTIQLTAQ